MRGSPPGWWSAVPPCIAPSGALWKATWTWPRLEAPRAAAAPKLTGKAEALLVVAACSKPPAGRARWALEMLSDALVKLTEHDSLSRQTVRRRLAFHYTPKHASRLDMVEIEIGVLRSQCLGRRIADREKLVSEIDAWERQRNDSGARIKWMFTTEKARTKMPRAYPQPEYERIPQAKES